MVEFPPRTIYRDHAENTQTQAQELGRVSLKKPWHVDAIRLGSEFFHPLYYRTFQIPDGSVYICTTTPQHEVNKTVILFEKPTHQGFTSLYSSMTSDKLSNIINRNFDIAKQGKGFLKRRSITRLRKQLLGKLKLETADK